MKLIHLILPFTLATACCSAKPPPPAPPRTSCAPPRPKAIPLLPSFCGSAHGYYWDGSACRATGIEEDRCACDLRLECELFDTLDACEVAHAHCR